MGTRWSARIVAPEEGLSRDAPRAIERTLDGVIAEMSHWDPASDISRINRDPPGGWQAIPPAFSHVLGAALDVAARSDGAFDPAMGRLADLWGFGPSGPRDAPPDASEVEEALRLSGGDAVEHDPALLRLRRDRGVWLDFSGIAKGYAVDAVAAALRTLGIADFLVEIGGELVGEGVKPDGTPWWVDIEQPPGAALAPLRFALHGIAVATSGDYARGYDHGGTRVHHSIDPRTGRPIAHGTASVTVAHARAMSADAWATAITVLGPEKGMALAEKEGLAVQMIVARDGGFLEHISPMLQAMLA